MDLQIINIWWRLKWKYCNFLRCNSWTVDATSLELVPLEVFDKLVVIVAEDDPIELAMAGDEDNGIGMLAKATTGEEATWDDSVSWEEE